MSSAFDQAAEVYDQGHSDDRSRAEDDGFTQPILVQDGTNIVVDGEHRWRAAQTVGLKKVPVVFTKMTPEQARIATLRHNRARGSENVSLVAMMIRDLASGDDGREVLQDMLLMAEEEIDLFLAAVPDSEAAIEVKDEIERRGGDLSPDEAADLMRQKEKEIEAEKDEEDRNSLKQDSAVYRLSLTFTNEEGKIVKAVLGDAPAENIIKLCRAATEGQAA
jgi:ParB-like chromosome segregation protein Spo0J